MALPTAPTLLVITACLLSPAAADLEGFSKAAAAAGKAAAQSLTAATAADPDFRIQDFAGPSVTLDTVQGADNVTVAAASGASNNEDNAQQRLKLAQELKTHLETVFAQRPDALARIRNALEREQKAAFNSSGWGYRREGLTTTAKAMPEDNKPVEGMDRRPHPPAVAKALNALYEADHPLFESRMEELVRDRGYPLERHPVVTSDDYELIVFRIPHGKNRHNQPGKRPVVFLQYGITLASDEYVIMNENESLGFILADAGFDVWFGNTRGNTYSRRNLNGLYPYQLEFWYFSLDELALIDLPTMVDYALQTSGASKLAYTGHSQGCSLALMLCAGRPEYNAKFSVIAHLGPVAFVEFMRAPFLRFAAANYLDVTFLYEVLGTLGIGEFIPNRLTAPLYGILCHKWILDEVCAAALSYIFYGASVFITPDDYSTIALTWPSGVSNRNLVHWAQMFRSPELQMRKYDFGTNCHTHKWKPGLGITKKAFYESCNQEKYGTTEPPVYNLTKITAPNVLFLGDNDIVAVGSNVDELVRRIGQAHVGDFIYTDYAHMDFVWDRNAKHAVDLADVFFRFSPGTF